VAIFRTAIPNQVRKMTRKIKDIIKYPPETLKTYRVLMYEWIDNLNFILDPSDHVDNAKDYIKTAGDLFRNSGWDGVGKIGLMWIPPFMLKGPRTNDSTSGVIVWHVKQIDDGLSWILTPIELPFEAEFEK
jgi:hypothetical protein